MCPTCNRQNANPNSWVACVQASGGSWNGGSRTWLPLGLSVDAAAATNTRPARLQIVAAPSLSAPASFGLPSRRCGSTWRTSAPSFTWSS